MDTKKLLFFFSQLDKKPEMILNLLQAIRLKED